jgi:hypothetical protein
MYISDVAARHYPFPTQSVKHLPFQHRLASQVRAWLERAASAAQSWTRVWATIFAGDYDRAERLPLNGKARGICAMRATDIDVLPDPGSAVSA